MIEEKVGKFIKEIRRKNNLTQKELADKLGVTFQAVSKWENGKNIPDIQLLQEISKMFNVDINEILEGEKKKKENDNKKLYILFGLILILGIIIIIILSNSSGHDFEFKQISTNCENFNITGSMAYNKDKTSLYISSIEFCGTDDNATYKTIECKLYESYDGDDKEISTCKIDNDITLKEYLKEIKIGVDNYEQSCNNINKDLYLEISATEENNKNIIYKIPITLEDNCIK